jgi:hypothetical protein
MVEVVMLFVKLVKFVVMNLLPVAAGADIGSAILQCLC